ncbi:hypothetical protein E2C01_030764 [Portunus trituberculatus]|uniref:Uncharacterized protein n=1 Tax=Portunus trituberculatus TaxID=210409 RepID=A0A5B7ERA3_PORTR|nr:hypothetical protein [Portunus trituberculatus]
MTLRRYPRSGIHRVLVSSFTQPAPTPSPTTTVHTPPRPLFEVPTLLHQHPPPHPLYCCFVEPHSGFWPGKGHSSSLHSPDSSVCSVRHT